LTCCVHGSAFSSVASASNSDFELSGASELKSFESSPGKHRYLCSNCGTQIYAKHTKKTNIILRLGSLDSKVPVKELAHTWTSDGASWFNLHAELPHYDKSLSKT
jgi:hypothetical protein